MAIFKKKEQRDYSPEEVYEKLSEIEKYTIFYNANRISKEEFDAKQEEFEDALKSLKKDYKKQYKKIKSRHNSILSRLEEMCFFRA